MPYIGHYINLDRSPERRAAMEAQLARMNPPGRYQRFPAVDGKPHGFPGSELTSVQTGCLTSHYLVLQMHLDQTHHLHIIEDDAVLAHRTVRLVEQIISSGMLDQYDILFTTSLIPGHFSQYREARHNWKSLITRAPDGTATDVRFTLIPYFACTDSYLVNRRSIRMICDIVGLELERGARYPIDLLIRGEALQGKLRIGCLFPFITSVRPGEFVSTIMDADEERLTFLALDLLRHSFFVECDLDSCLELANRHLSHLEMDTQNRLHARIAGFFATDALRIR
jgi:GR25 family glycosyltransferase involved in LPS biosynthesis